MLKNKIKEVKNKYGNNYKVVYWATEENRDMGTSDLYCLDFSLEEAISAAKRIIGDYAVSAEVRVHDKNSNFNNEVVFYCGPDEKEENYIEEWEV